MSRPLKETSSILALSLFPLLLRHLSSNRLRLLLVLTVSSEDINHPVVDFEPLNLIDDNPSLNGIDLQLVVGSLDVLHDNERLLKLHIVRSKPRAHNGLLVLAVEQQHLLHAAVVAGAHEAGGVSEVEVDVAVEDDDELLVGLLVEDQLLHIVRDHLSRALGREAKVLPQSIDTVDAGLGELGDPLEGVGPVILDGEVCESLDGHTSAGLQFDSLLHGDSVMEPHKPDDLLAVGEEEEPESLVHRLGEAVIGEGVQV